MEHDDVGAQMARALDELWEHGQQAVADNGGAPVVIVDWHAPGVDLAEDNALIRDALDALRQPEDRGPDDPGPR